MLSLVVSHNAFVTHVEGLSGQWHLTPDEDGVVLEGVTRPFGNSVPSIFERPQPMAGFGAECKRLIDNGKVAGVEGMENLISKVYFSGDPSESFENLLRILDEIAAKAKKIGDAQRVFFQLGFRALLLEESDSFLDLSTCWLRAQENYEMMY